MAIHENVKKIISNVVFPELVKNGEYASFSEDATGRFDYVAYALKELKEGKVISPWCNDVIERIRVVICDKEYPDGLLEFDLKYLIEEVFSGTWYKDDAVNTILIVRQVDGMLDFSWIRLRDFIQRMAERCLTLRHLKNDLQMRPQCNVTLYSGHPGELFLRDVGKPDRLLLNYKEFFFENRIRDFQIALEDERLRDINLGWIGALKMPGSDLLSRQELDARLQGGFEKVVKDFISNACGQFALGNASKDSEYYSQDVFDRVVGTVASLIAHEPEIASYDLIANLSRMIAPIPMRGWVRDVAVQYKAMLEENVYEMMEKQRLGSMKKIPVMDIKKPIVVRIGCMYSDDWDFNDYEEGERIRIGKDVISANFMILENEDQDEALDGREGELPTSFDYELHDGQLCAIVEGKFIPCEDDIEFEQRLNEIDYEL